ncbi:MAG: hypothetical protein H7Y01_09590 [Ferruginibacter sp.]|nr:hypothetical protein [Chitinophagaceae bacterium]
MTFSSIELRNKSGEVLPTDGHGTSFCNFDAGNVSELIRYVTLIDDRNAPQDVKLITTIKDKTFYEFGEPPVNRKTHFFNTGNGFTFEFQLRRLNQEGPTINCSITSTLVFIDANGGEERERLTVTIEFQNS